MQNRPARLGNRPTCPLPLLKRTGIPIFQDHTPTMLGLIVPVGETLEIASEDMESAFNLFLIPPAWKSFLAFLPDGDPHQWVSCGCNHCSLGVGRRGGPHQHIARRLVFNIAGVACLGSLFGGFFPTPPSPQLGLHEWRGCGRLLKRSSQQHAHGYSSLSSCKSWPRASAPRWETGGQGVLCTHSQCEVSRAWDKGQSMAFTMLSLLCRSQWSASALQHRAGLCTFAGGVRRPLFSVFREGQSKVSGTNPKGVDPPFVAQPCSEFSMRLSALEGGVCDPSHRFLFGMWPNRFLPYFPSSRLARKCRKIEEWSLSTGSRFFFVHPRTLGSLPHGEMSLTFLCF